ncbi:MAG: hypothetical protein JNM83_02090 [Myxococcales bacterium]|nr:hypothetical protein [Myxococcales bacterium]
MSAKHLSVLLFVAAAALPGRASALQCSSLPEPAYVIATPSAEPMVQKVASLLQRTDAQRMTVIYQIRPSCKALEAVARDTLPASCATDACIRGKALFFTLDPRDTEPKECDLESTGSKVDLALSDVFPQTCPAFAQTAPSGILDNPGPVSPYSLVMLRSATEAAIHAEEAHFVFGAGKSANIKPWFNDAVIAHLGTQDAGVLLVGNRIKLASARWKGTTVASVDDLVSTIYNDAEHGIGILPTTVVDRRRAELRPLAFQAVGQKGSFFPDRRSTTYDKQNVRDGHYPLWGYLHTVLRQDPGNPGQPLSKKGSRLSDIFLGKGLVGGQDSQLLQVQNGFVPQCAMKVTRTSDPTPLSIYAPAEPCHCFFEHNVSQGGNPTCQQCPAGTCGSGVCRRKYCEAQ